MYKNVRCTCKVVVLPTKPFVVFDVLVAVVDIVSASARQLVSSYLPVTFGLFFQHMPG